MAVTAETEGRRTYLRGDTYSVRDRLRAAGAHWDPQARAWWIGDVARAKTLVASLRTTATTSPASPADSRDRPDPGHTIVAGAGEYRGRHCRIVGRVVRGSTHWDDAVEAVVGRGGSAMLLCSMDGTRQWWADTSSVTVTRAYQRPTTIGRILRYAQEARSNGGIHPDACPRCGSTSCSAARGRGGLCDED